MLFYRKYEHNTSYIDMFIIWNHIRNPPLCDSYDLREVREEPEASFAQTAASPISPKRRRTISAATFQSRSPRKTSPPISIRAVRTFPKNSKKKRANRFPTLSKKKNFKRAATCRRPQKNRLPPSPPISASPPKATLPTPSKSISPSLRRYTAASTPLIDTKYLCSPRPRQSFLAAIYAFYRYLPKNFL